MLIFVHLSFSLSSLSPFSLSSVFPVSALFCDMIKSESQFGMPTSGSDLSTHAEHERGSRRPRRYFSPGESRKTSERFRTQPITSAERKETDR